LTPDFDPEIIDEAPIDLPQPGNQSAAEKENRNLRNQIGILEQDRDGKEKASLATEKAKLLQPFSEYVFWFCACYTTATVIIIILHGCDGVEFDLDTSTINLIAGSNIANVIGLLGAFVTGLLRSR